MEIIKAVSKPPAKLPQFIDLTQGFEQGEGSQEVGINDQQESILGTQLESIGQDISGIEPDGQYKPKVTKKPTKDIDEVSDEDVHEELRKKNIGTSHHLSVTQRGLSPKFIHMYAHVKALAPESIPNSYIIRL